MNCPTRIHVDEPESMTRLTQSEKTICREMLLVLVADMLFCVKNNLLDDGTGDDMVLTKPVKVLSNNVVVRNIPRGFITQHRRERLVSPLVEFATMVIPILYRANPHSEVVVIIDGK